MSELTYLAAAKEDIPAIFALCKDLIDAYEDVESIDYAHVTAWVGEKIRENISSYTCVYCNGEKAGYYHLTEEADGWELDDLYILPSFRSRGIGSQILKRCIEQTNGPIYLYVFKKNTGAIRLYEKFGFVTERKVGNTRMIMRREG